MMNRADEPLPYSTGNQLVVCNRERYVRPVAPLAKKHNEQRNTTNKETQRTKKHNEQRNTTNKETNSINERVTS